MAAAAVSAEREGSTAAALKTSSAAKAMKTAATAKAVESRDAAAVEARGRRSPGARAMKTPAAAKAMKRRNAAALEARGHRRCSPKPGPSIVPPPLLKRWKAGTPPPWKAGDVGGRRAPDPETARRRENLVRSARMPNANSMGAMAPDPVSGVPAVPAIGAAPTEAIQPRVAAQIPAGTLPAIIVPTVIAVIIKRIVLELFSTGDTNLPMKKARLRHDRRRPPARRSQPPKTQSPRLQPRMKICETSPTSRRAQAG